MGVWNPERGTLYRTLLDQCRSVFGIQGLTAPSGHGCFSDPAGDACHCHWVADDFSVLIHTPQLYGTSPHGGCRFPKFTPDLRAWLRKERFWNRTTGVLCVLRAARQSSAHLEWVDFARISDGFSLALPGEIVQEARTVLERMIVRDEWFEAVRRRDGGYDLEPTAGTPKRPVRGVSIHTAAARIVVGECLDELALPVFELPAGRGIIHPDGLPNSPAGRLELFQYEFNLLGPNSFEFRIAGQ